jgi:hypothetical protein
MSETLILLRCGHWWSATRIGGGEPMDFLAPAVSAPARCPETDELTEVEHRIVVAHPHGEGE